jgi:hypothetical protein
MLRLPLGSSAKGHIVSLLFLAIAAVSSSAVPARAEATTNNIEQSQKQLQELIGKCQNDLACLQQNASQIDGMPLLGLSLALLKTDPSAALDWLVIAQLRTRYDVQRCTDQSIGGGATFLFGQLGGEVVQYARRHKLQYLAALKRVQQRNDVFTPDRAPLCGSGLDRSGPAVKPASEWPAIAADLAQQLAQDIDKLDKEYAANPPADYEPPSFPTQVPAAALSGSRAEKAATIGAEARRAALAAAVESSSPEVLFTIAEAQLDASDVAGARDTLAAAQDATRKLPKTLETQREWLSTLWIRAGEIQKGIDVAESTPDSSGQPSGGLTSDRLLALAHLGSDLAKIGDIAGARKLLDLVPQTGTDSGPARHSPSEGTSRRIGIALAQAGDFAGALDAVGRLSDAHRGSALAEIAAWQCRARHKDAAETLGLAIAAHPQYAFLTASAMASCGEVDQTLALVEQLDPKERKRTLEQVAEHLMAARLFAEVERVDAVIAGKSLDIDDLAKLAKRQVIRGDTAGAQSTAARAYGMMQRAVAAAREQPEFRAGAFQALHSLPTILEVQLTLAAYEEALATAQLQDAINAKQFLVLIVQAQAKKHDSEALQRMLPRVIQHIESAGGGAGISLIDLAKRLGRAGYADEARDALRHAAQLKDEQCSRFPCVNLAEALLAIGDIDGARAILPRFQRQHRDGVLRAFVKELVDPEEPSTVTPRPLGTPAPPPPRDSSAVFPVAAGMAWEIQDAAVRAQAMLVLLRSLRS